MKVNSLVLTLLIAGVFTQIENLGEMNGCAKDTLGNSLPLEEQDCYVDKSSVDFNCCFIKASMKGVSVNFCYPISKNKDITLIEESVATYGPSASVKCTATSISLSLMLVAILALFLF